MRNDARRHLVEGDLARSGWAVYREALGCQGLPGLVAVRGERTLLVAVAAAIENGRGTYPAWGRGEGADVLASVDSSGSITYADPVRRSVAGSLAFVAPSTHEPVRRHLTPVAPRYG